MLLKNWKNQDSLFISSIRIEDPIMELVMRLLGNCTLPCEFGHAYNAITGKYRKYESEEVRNGNRTHIDNLNENEKFSIELENILRAIFGVKQRSGKYYERNN